MPPTIAELDTETLRAGLAGDGLSIDLGAARVRIRSDVPQLPALLQLVYGAFTLEPPGGVHDVTAALRRKRGLRRYVRPQLEVLIDGAVDFEPFPADTPLPLLEWGMNYALAQRACWCLLLHAGVVERNGRAIVLPAMPGAGKSTLTAALASRGFRLLSDEFGVVGFDDSLLTPLLRPIALKNQSIDVIERFAPGAVIGPRYPKTHKGTVAHLAPAAAHVAARHVRAAPGLVIFPRFVASAGVEVEPVPRARAFARLAVNSFNYEFAGPRGFDALGRLIGASDSYQLLYGDMEGAIAKIAALVDALPAFAASAADTPALATS
jgi:HprK-related kinase A